MQQKILEIKELSKKLKGKDILNNVSFHVNKGEIFGVIGKSGVGKTTLLKLLIGFLKPTKGNILYNGNEITNNIKNFQSEVGFLTQDDCFYDELTVQENLFYFGKMFNVPMTNIILSSERILKFLKLNNNVNTLSSNLSGGMKRRLDFACAMIHNPNILIMDEPTSGLDPLLRKQFWSYVKYINKMGKTIIFTSHQLDELEHLCDSVVILDEGKVKEFNSVENIKGKYEKNYEMNLRTNPGNYHKIVQSLKFDKINIKNYNISDHTLLLFTPNPHDTLKDLIPILDNLNEKLIDVDLRRPNLNEIFEFYIGEIKK
jgi:ABC-2 type transport system ATP-binding protein